MQLLIIRHAIAFERDPHRWADDALRPLSPAGVKRSRKSAAGLKTLCRAPVRLLTSPLVRAAQTADILSKIAGWPRADIAPELAPGKGAATVLALLARDRSGHIALVGHQPDLSELLSACLLKEGKPLAIEMKKNAVACVSFPGRARAGGGSLEWLATPRLLRALRKS